MKHLVIFSDSSRENVARAVADFTTWLGSRCRVQSVDLRTPGGPVNFENVDAAVVFGGDGSFLTAARRLGGCEIPLVGVNLGKLGFLAELSEDELRESLDDILSGKHQPVKRLMLQARIERPDGTTGGPFLALNDLVLRHVLPTHMLSFRLSVNGEEATDYAGDGLIISTPVGSTAYALSAGGPILTPGVQCLVATPICPHALANRSLVMTSRCELRLELLDPAEQAHITLDGRETASVMPGDVVVVTAAPHPLCLIETGKRTFFQTLREKMNWEGHPNYGPPG
ncbi:MAG TPA: NAD(+)/NADH kinase [Planctomycetota bacterium]|nr:NAD(+)/NADH kinase [Planctomycetota bacterium]